MAANLRSAGHQVYVWSRTPRAAPNFLGSVVEVADLCDVIQLFVSDDGALQEVIRTVAAALAPRHVVLCHATVSPMSTRQAAAIVEAQGARYLDAPFTGSKAAAQNRQLVYYIGGAKPALEEVRPVLEGSSKAILHLGGIGDASVLKIATNMLTATTVQTLAEALALVRAAGIDGSKLVEALENNGSRSGTSDLKLPAMIAANTEPNFSLKHMLKDVRFAQELADQYQLSLPVTDTTSEILALGMQNDWGDRDFSVVGQLYPAPAAPSVSRPLEPVPAKAAPVEAPPAPVAVSEKPVVVDAAPPAPTPVAPPAAAPEKPAVETVKPPTPVSEEKLAEVTLPPRPNLDAKPVPPEIPPPADKTQADKPAEVSANGSAIPDDKKDEGSPVKPVEPTPAKAAPSSIEEIARKKKSTFQFLRNFFKPVSTEPR